VEVPLSPRFAIRFHADGLATLRAVRTVLDGVEVSKTAPVSGAFGAGPALSF
jgi:hypothetical protein